MINYFKAAERLLAQRGNLEQALENLGRRRELASTQAKAERDNIKPRPYASSGGINAHTSARLELAEINREIVATRSTIAEIDRVLAQLDDADAELLRAWYIEHKSKGELATLQHPQTHGERGRLPLQAGPNSDPQEKPPPPEKTMHPGPETDRGPPQNSADPGTGNFITVGTAKALCRVEPLR